MQIFIDLLNSLGMNVSSNSSPLILFLIVIIGFALLGMLSVLNIGIYLAVLYLSNNKLFLDKISEWTILNRILNIYKKTRIVFIQFEILMFLFCQCSIIWFCLKFINGIS